MSKTTFKRTEVAQLVDLYEKLRANPLLREQLGLTEKKVAAMLFKLWRILNATKGIIC